MKDHKQELNDNSAIVDAADLQWQVDQFVLGCGIEDEESGFDRDSFEELMLRDEHLALRVAAAVEEWGLIGQAAGSLPTEDSHAESIRVSSTSELSASQEVMSTRRFASAADACT